MMAGREKHLPGHPTTRWTGICQPSGKRIWATRREAKAALRTGHPGDTSMRVYVCEENPNHYHYGHTTTKRPGIDRSIPVHCGHAQPHPPHVWFDSERRTWACPGTPEKENGS